MIGNLRLLDPLTYWRGEVRNDIGIDLTVSWALVDDKVVMVLAKRENRNACGLIIPKGGEPFLH